MANKPLLMLQLGLLNNVNKMLSSVLYYRTDSPSMLWMKIRPLVDPGHGFLNRMHWEQCGSLLSH